MNRTIRAATLAAVLLGGCATTGDAPAGYANEYYIDQVVPLPEDGVASVSIRSGPVEVVELRVRNRPTTKDIAEDTRKTDTSHPKPVVTALNHGSQLAWVTLESILEDANGTPLMRCNSRNPQELFAGVKDDWNTCFMEGIPTHEWPRVTHFHLRVAIKVREATRGPVVKPAGIDGQRLEIPFASAERTADGAKVDVTRYSERTDDVAYTGSEFAGGVVTIRGQVGFGKGSQWAGLGPWWDLRGDGAPVDASGFKSVTFRLASSARQLRLQLVGADPVVRNGGCYPVTVIDVSDKLEEYAVPLSRFAPEAWCGSRGRTAAETLSRLTAFEVASTRISGRPLFISVGTTTLNP